MNRPLATSRDDAAGRACAFFFGCITGAVIVYALAILALKH